MRERSERTVGRRRKIMTPKGPRRIPGVSEANARESSATQEILRRSHGCKISLHGEIGPKAHKPRQMNSFDYAFRSLRRLHGAGAMSYISLRYHIVFSTKDRAPMIQETWIANLHAFLGGCINALGGVPFPVGGVEDHVHLFARLNPTHRVSDVLREVKSVSSQWVHREIGERRFDWQDGYSAFSVSASAVDRVVAYIDGEREHHRKRTFREELEALLKANGIPFDPRYL